MRILLCKFMESDKRGARLKVYGLGIAPIYYSRRYDLTLEHQSKRAIYATATRYQLLRGPRILYGTMPSGEMAGVLVEKDVVKNLLKEFDYVPDPSYDEPLNYNQE